MIEFKKFQAPHRTLAIIERLPFPIKRVYYWYGISGGGDYKGHAHKTLERVIIPIAGTFTAWIDNMKMLLNDPARGLYVPPMSWLYLDNFSHNAVCLILASAEYDESDYVRDMEEFMRMRMAA